MAGKRLTPEEDFERLAERVWNMYGERIEDYESFETAFNDYMEDEISDIADIESLRRKTFNAMRRKHSSIKRRGVKKEVRKKGRPEVEIPEEEIEEKKFKKIGYIHSRQVYSRATVFTRWNKQITRYRDRKGRFVRIKK